MAATIALSSIAEGFDSAAVTVDDAAAWVLVATFVAGGRFQGRPLAVEGVAGTNGALAGLRVDWTPVPSGTNFTTLLTDTDFNAPPDGFRLLFSDPNPHLTPAGGTFRVVLGRVGAIVKVYAKKASADTTLQLVGRPWAV